MIIPKHKLVKNGDLITLTMGGQPCQCPWIPSIPLLQKHELSGRQEVQTLRNSCDNNCPMFQVKHNRNGGYDVALNCSRREFVIEQIPMDEQDGQGRTLDLIGPTKM